MQPYFTGAAAWADASLLASISASDGTNLSLDTAALHLRVTMQKDTLSVLFMDNPFLYKWLEVLVLELCHKPWSVVLPHQ